MNDPLAGAWPLIRDMAPMLFLLALTALAGLLILRAVSQEVRKWRDGRYYRYYQIGLVLLLIYYCGRLVYVLSHLQHQSH